nr:PREDICTED: uncharacterized protein LOC104150904 [Struthio camelus australis]
MVLQGLVLAFLLVLAPLSATQGEEEPGPKAQGVPQKTEACQHPQWDQRLQLVPDRVTYQKNEEVVLSCPEGLQPSFTEVKCASEVWSVSHGKPVYREVWMGRNGTGGWIRIRSNVECIELLQVVPGSWEVSATSIKLNWTCRFPDACQHMRATCQLVGPAFPTCEAEDVRGEKLLRGQKGTFTCAPLQPFTVYSITISLPPSTVLFTWQFQTEEMVPDKPENLSLDPSTGSLRWNALPSCKGEILGYQLGITARSTREGSFLEIERLRLNSSVTEYRLPDYRQTTAPLNVSSRGARDISRSQGTAVLPLRPITQPHEAVREHQLIVAANQDAAAVAGAEKFTCVCYSFSVAAGQATAPWPWTAVTVVLVLFVLAFLIAGILWFVLSRKKKALISQAEENK